MAQRVRDYNYALRDLAETRARDFGDRVRFSEGAYGNNFTADDVSVDCFHPNPEGQNKIAESTWHGNWWAK